MTEQRPERPQPMGYAILARFDMRPGIHVTERTRQQDLVVGQAAVFTGNEEILFFPTLDALTTALSDGTVHPGTAELLAVMTNNGLLLTQGRENSYGISKEMADAMKAEGLPPVIQLSSADKSHTIAAIWGDDKNDAYRTLQQLQEKRAELN